MLEHVADREMSTLQPMLIGNTDAEFGPGVINPNCTGGIQLPKGLTPEQLAVVVSAVAFTCPAKEAARVRYAIPIYTFQYRLSTVV